MPEASYNLGISPELWDISMLPFEHRLLLATEAFIRDVNA